MWDDGEINSLSGKAQGVCDKLWKSTIKGCIKYTNVQDLMGLLKVWDNSIEEHKDTIQQLNNKFHALSN